MSSTSSVGSVWQEFYWAMAHRVRELAGRADPFIRRRLLVLAERYEAKGGKPSPLSRSAERPLPPLRIVPPAMAIPVSGEAWGTSSSLAAGARLSLGPTAALTPSVIVDTGSPLREPSNRSCRCAASGRLRLHAPRDNHGDRFTAASRFRRRLGPDLPRVPDPRGFRAMPIPARRWRISSGARLFRRRTKACCGTGWR
jgi:hypothetical protein